MNFEPDSVMMAVSSPTQTCLSSSSFIYYISCFWYPWHCTSLAQMPTLLLKCFDIMVLLYEAKKRFLEQKKGPTRARRRILAPGTCWTLFCTSFTTISSFTIFFGMVGVIIISWATNILHSWCYDLILVDKFGLCVPLETRMHSWS